MSTKLHFILCKPYQKIDNNLLFVFIVMFKHEVV